MKCQKCGKNEANTHITRIINGEKTELFLCSDCAAVSSEVSEFKTSFDNELENFFGSFFGGPYIGKGRESLSGGALRCPKCSSTAESITKSGRLGCSECYKTFRDLLMRPLKQIHGASRHTGKIPARAGKDIKVATQLDKLQTDLNLAVMKQDFERAAEIRDRINDLKNGGQR